MKTLRLLLPLLMAGAASASYQYYYTDSLTSINSANWTQVGSPQATSYGLGGYGSLVSKVSSPTGNDYDIQVAFNCPNSPVCYGFTLFARSTSDTSTSYAFSVMLGGVQLVKNVANSQTVLATWPYYGVTGEVFRLVVRGNTIAAFVGAYTFTYNDPSPITSGQPGVGNQCSQAYLTNVKFGPIDYTAPPAINQSQVTSSQTGQWVDLYWPVGSDDGNGPGLQGYTVSRYSSALGTIYLGAPTKPNWTDETVAPGTSYTYYLTACSQSGSCSTATSYGVTTPSSTQQAATDQRRIGVRSTGAYWGGAGERIDMNSGNLNFSVPVLTAMGRGNWSVTFALSYNSQMWRNDGGGIRLLGEDLGLGLGWKLQAGSVRPVWLNGAIHHFV
jgi:hypothetical protein